MPSTYFFVPGIHSGNLDSRLLRRAQNPWQAVVFLEKLYLLNELNKDTLFYELWQTTFINCKLLAFIVLDLGSPFFL
jgi:hypothetical protein